MEIKGLEDQLLRVRPDLTPVGGGGGGTPL